MARVRALKPCYCGVPMALREAGDEFEYVGPRASYLELLEGEFVSTAKRPQLDHDRDGREGGAAPADQPAPAATAADEPKARAKAERSPEEKAERAAAIAKLREAGVKFFAGDTTENLKAQADKL